MSETTQGGERTGNYMAISKPDRLYPGKWAVHVYVDGLVRACIAMPDTEAEAQAVVDAFYPCGAVWLDPGVVPALQSAVRRRPLHHRGAGARRNAGGGGMELKDYDWSREPTEDDDHEVIFLQPVDGDGAEGRTWCQDSIDPDVTIDTAYVRADEYAKLQDSYEGAMDLICRFYSRGTQRPPPMDESLGGDAVAAMKSWAGA